jgi:hypothetical protein
MPLRELTREELSPRGGKQIPFDFAQGRLSLRSE